MDENERSSPAVILASLGAAGLFDALTVLGTQDKSVRAVSPWHEDPYDAVVSLCQLAVPMLGLVILLRLLAWRAPGGPDRGQQTARAAGAMLTLVVLTLVAEWSAVIGGVNDSVWNGWTFVLIGGLIVNSMLTGGVVVSLWRGRRRGSFPRWRHDWLGDVILLCERTPVSRRWIGPEAVAWVRQHAMTVFVTASLLAAIAITGLQAFGEQWTNPLLIAWMLVVELASYLSFCVITNAVVGFIARPPRARLRRVAETSVVTGCVAIHATIAFRDALWPGSAPLTSVPALAVFTLGAGLAAALATAGLLIVRTSRPNPPDGVTARSLPPSDDPGTYQERHVMEPSAEKSAAPMICARELSKRYGRRQAVSDLGFAVESGQICGLLGPNGAGKTSAMRMLVGLSSPDAGSARILGEPVGLGAGVLRGVGVLIDGPAFVPHMTGLEEVDRDDAFGLGGEELGPCRTAPPWCRIQARFDQDVADRAGGDAVAQAQ